MRINSPSVTPGVWLRHADEGNLSNDDELLYHDILLIIEGEYVILYER